MTFLPDKRFDFAGISYKAILYLVIGLALLIYSPFAFFGGILAFMFSGASGTSGSLLVGFSHFVFGLFIPIWGIMFLIKSTRLFRRVPPPPASLPKKIIITAVFIVPILFYLLAPQLSGVVSGSNEGDSRRVSDIRQIALALENYYDEFGSYPARLDALIPDYYSGLTYDIETGNRYYYNSVNCQVPGQKYVVGAILRKDNPTLKSLDDADGVICGVDCNDSVGRYCITTD